MIRIACCVAAVLIAGCATSPGNMRQDIDAKRTVLLAMPYQQVLKRIVDQYAECTPAPMLPIGTLINDVQHYTDLRQASTVRTPERLAPLLQRALPRRRLGRLGQRALPGRGRAKPRG